MHVITPFLLVGAGVCSYLVAIYAKYITSEEDVLGDKGDILSKYFSGKRYQKANDPRAPITSWGPIHQGLAAILFIYLAVAIEYGKLGSVMKWVSIVALLYLAGALFFEYNAMSYIWTPELRAEVVKNKSSIDSIAAKANKHHDRINVGPIDTYMTSVLAWLDYDGPSSLAVGLLCLATAGYLGAYEKLKGLVLKSKRR
jgi:hypothetical protein